MTLRSSRLYASEQFVRVSTIYVLVNHPPTIQNKHRRRPSGTHLKQEKEEAVF